MQKVKSTALGLFATIAIMLVGTIARGDSNFIAAVTGETRPDPDNSIAYVTLRNRADQDIKCTVKVEGIVVGRSSVGNTLTAHVFSEAVVGFTLPVNRSAERGFNFAPQVSHLRSVWHDTTAQLVEVLDDSIDASCDLEGGGGGVRKVMALTSGYLHSCAIKADRALVCWGYNDYGQTNVPFGFHAKAVAGGSKFTCAIDTANSVVCWGSNSQNQLQVPSGLKAKAIAAGRGHACAITLNDRVSCWGGNSHGEASVPASIIAKDIALGDDLSCVIASNGSLSCFGDNSLHGTEVADTLLAKDLSVASGGCAISMDGLVKCWGNNTYHAPSHFGAKAIDVDSNLTCAVDANDAVSCWGFNDQSESLIPPGDLKAELLQVNFGGSSVCTVTKGGDGVICWGNNDYGQNNVPADILPFN